MSSEQIEYEPHGEPTAEVEDHEVYVYDSGGIVPDVLITTVEGDEQFRLWGFQGEGPMLVLMIHTEHRHPPDYPDGTCQKWTVMNDEWPNLADAEPAPQVVRDIAIEVSDAPLLDRSHGVE